MNGIKSISGLNSLVKRSRITNWSGNQNHSQSSYLTFQKTLNRRFTEYNRHFSVNSTPDPLPPIKDKPESPTSSSQL